MIARVRSTERGRRTPGGNFPGCVSAFGTIGRPWSSSVCSSRGFKSLIVRQHRHLKRGSSLGTLTRLSQHMHFRVVLVPSSTALPLLPDITREGAGPADSLTRTNPSSGVPFVLWKLVLLLRPKILGSGLLAERLWVCWRAPAVRGRVGDGALRSWFNVG